MVISIIVEIYVCFASDFDYTRNYYNLCISFRLYSKVLGYTSIVSIINEISINRAVYSNHKILTYRKYLCYNKIIEESST